MGFTQRFLDNLNSIPPANLADMCGLKYKATSTGVDAFSFANEEKTPSLKINEKGGITVWKDFSSGDGGNAIKLFMATSGLDFIAACESMAQQQGIEVEYDQKDNQQKQGPARTKLFKAIDWAAKCYEDNRSHVLSYLYSRGFNEEVAKKWKLGFAKDEWQFITNKLKPEQQQVAQEVGLIRRSSNNGKLFDFFRNRLTFPIEQGGKVVAMAGRTLGDDKPKYINSAASATFDKSKTLYGFDNACKIGGSYCLAVEGYFDVIALDTINIPSAGTCGTVITLDHIRKLYSRFDEIVFCFDGDLAGQKAKRKALQLVLPFIKDGKSASFITLPEGKDPADLILEGNVLEFEKRETLSEALTAGVDSMTEAEKMAFLTDISGKFNQLEDSLQKLFLIHRISEKLRMDSNLVKQSFGF
jgi:DNA primase